MSAHNMPPLPEEVRHPKVHPRVQVILILLATAGLIAAVVIGGIVSYQESLTSGRQTDIIGKQDNQIAALSNSLDAVRAQVTKSGHTPVAPSAETITGKDGTNGANGLNGLNGKDGRSVLSLACQSNGTWLVTYDDNTTQEITGPCIGANGSDGQNGTNGTNGVDGAAGQPPASWTWVSSSGTTRICNRTADFDPNNPTYVCTVQSTPTPAPSN